MANISKPTGTEQEIQTFSVVMKHKEMAEEDLDGAKLHQFDKADELFRSHINDGPDWPYNSVVFDPRVFTAIFEKTARLFAKKPRGRLVPRDGGDTLGARVFNELLNFQWDDNERASGQSMLAKWAQMDQNARKYGAAFGLCKWHYETMPGEDKKRKTFFDGPDFKVWNNRDVLHNPSYSTIKNWIQLRNYPTLQELQNVNDAAKSKPAYKNLDILRDKLREESKDGGGDRRDNNYIIKNRSIQGLGDQLGRDVEYKTVEVVTEYRKDRWITFAPKHGLILRDIPNPYKHQQIPVVMLRYYPVDDDLYGLSEIEPVQRLQKGINSLINQYLDAINMSLYPVLKVRSTGVEMHTLQFGPGEKWIMDDPANVIPHEFSPAGIGEFTSTYKFMVSAMLEALGETSAGISAINPGDGEKTATEIKDTALQRNARDNFNQIFLQEAMKKQMMFWYKMDTQFMFSSTKDKVKMIRIIDRDAIRFFEKVGLNQVGISDEAAQLMSEMNIGELGLRPEDLATDMFPVETPNGTLPKFTKDVAGEMGFLLMEPDDLTGTYDYIPDVQSMSLPDDSQMAFARQNLLKTTAELAEALMQQGVEIDWEQMLEDTFEQMGLKDPEKYFKKSERGMNELNERGEESLAPSTQGEGNGGSTRVAGGNQAVSGEQNINLMG
jgi:hypothetical protein